MNVAQMQAAAVTKLSDRQLELTVGSRIGIRIFALAMAKMFRPTKADGFSGEIQFTLTTAKRERVFTIDCGASKAKARIGHATDPQLKLRAKLADFLRIGIGQISAPSAVITGRLDVQGDFQVASKLGEMFGGKSLF